MKKTSFFSAIISAITILSSIIINKIVSIYAGAEGLVVITQFKNLFSVSRTFSNGALNDGVVKYSSEYQNNTKLDEILSTGFKVAIVFSLLTGLILCLFSKTISIKLLYTEEYYHYIIALGLSLPMIGFYDFIISAVVGLKKMKEFYSVSIKTQLINIALTFFLTYLYGVKGAMLAITINLIIGFIILISYLKKPNWFSLKKISKPFNKDVFKDYSKYFVITFSVMVLSPIFEIVARDVIIQESTKEIAGYWIAMSRIATVALVFVQTTMRRYLLPVFSSTDDSVLIKQTINKSLKMIYAFLLLISIGMCLCKELVIRLLYSKDFLVISSIYEITIAVIFIDILSWVYSVWMISKGKYIGFSSSVIIRSLIFVSGLYVFVRENALFGVVYAYSVSIFIQFIFNYAYYKFNVKK